MGRLHARARAFAADEHGGVMVVLAFAIIAVSVMAGLTSIAITTGITALSQRATQSAESGMRAAVGTVLAEVNRGDGATKTIEHLEGREFRTTTGSAVKVVTSIDKALYDGTTVHMNLSITSNGRMDWTRKGTATLTLAHATSLSRVVDGRAAWDFAARTDRNEYSEQVVALWTAGEMTVFDADGANSTPIAPNRATIVKSLTDGVASFTATASGGCKAGQTVKLQTRFRVGAGHWSSWSDRDSASGDLDPGQQATFEARTACVEGANVSSWAMRSASILRAADVPNSPTVYFDMDETGNTVVTAVSDEKPTAGVTVDEQVRVRIGGGAWSPWAQSGTTTVALSPGQTLEAQGRVRVSSNVDDSGWVESAVVSQTFER